MCFGTSLASRRHTSRLTPGRQRSLTLLLLDPGERGASLAAALSERQGWQRLVKRGAHTLRCSQYQVLFVERGVAAGAELEQLKRVVAHERF